MHHFEQKWPFRLTLDEPYDHGLDTVYTDWISGCPVYKPGWHGRDQGERRLVGVSGVCAVL